MIISHTLRYVYIGIPRTGLKSMNQWLMQHYQGEWYGEHHDWCVPDFASDYLIFTTVRNPYDRAVSGYFGIPWDDLEPGENLRQQLPIPDRSANPLASILHEALAQKANSTGAGDLSQVDYVIKAGVSLVLYFERLPLALQELPFANQALISDFPHVLERGIRPPGSFFDLFSIEDEAAYWEYARQEFEAFGYKRYSMRLPATAQNTINFPSYP